MSRSQLPLLLLLSLLPVSSFPFPFPTPCLLFFLEEGRLPEDVFNKCAGLTGWKPVEECKWIQVLSPCTKVKFEWVKDLIH